jgi:hypothetical protein
MSTLIVNELDAHAMARSRMALVSGSIDMKRPGAYEVFGYPRQVTFELLLQAYERGGAGHGAVHRLLDKCWEQLPRIKPVKAGEEVTPWETKLQGVLKGCQAWAKLRDLDRKNMVGRYAAVIYRARDGKALREPLEKASELVDLVPVFEDQIKVTDWHADQADPDRYGKPAMFQYQSRRLDGGDTQAQPVDWQEVHPSRVQILAEGAVGDDFFQGVPLLRAGFNSLINLEKIEGGSGEGYLKNAARTLAFEFDANAPLNTIDAQGNETSAKPALEEQARRLNSNIDAAAVLQGGKVNALQTTMPDPTKPFEVAACMFAASVRIPFTVLFGQQTGRLASDEDKADFQARCKSRQTNELTPMLEQLVRRLQACGIVEAGDFIVEWPDLAAPSDADKLEHAKGMAEANKQAPGQGGDPIFTVNEIRQAAGYKPHAALPVGEGGDPADE